MPKASHSLSAFGVAGALLLSACSDSGTALPDSSEVPLQTSVPTIVTVSGPGDEAFSYQSEEALTEHAVPVLGLVPGQPASFELTVEIPGGPYAVEVLELEAAPLPSFFPEIQINAADPDRMEPGLTLANFSAGMGPDFITYPFMFDKDGTVRWYLDLSEIGAMTYLVQPLENGNFATAHAHRVFEFDPLGREVNRWEMPGYLYHHDVIELPDGNLLVLVSRDGDEVVNDHIVELDRGSGAVVREWDLRETLDPDRRTFQSSTDQNWAHTNGVWYDAQDDAMLISSRNQTAIIKMTMDDELVWIMGPHEGWPAHLEPYLLTAVDETGAPYAEAVQLGHEAHADFDWTWGQHTPVLLPDRRIFVFDNGAERHFTGLPDSYSRGVEYEIDEGEMTVRQTWQYGQERGPDYYSSIISNVQHLPETENRLIAPGILVFYRSIVTEVTYPEGEVVFEAEMFHQNESGTGEIAWGEFDLVYRSMRMELP